MNKVGTQSRKADIYLGWNLQPTALIFLVYTVWCLQVVKVISASFYYYI